MTAKRDYLSTIERNIARNMVQLRVSKELDQRSFAKKTGIAQSQLSYFETGDRTPLIKVLAKISSEFGVPITYFFDESDSAIIASAYKQFDDYAVAIKKLKELGHDLDDLQNVAVKDDAMHGVIRKGSIAVINTHRTKPNGNKAVYAIKSGENITFRYINKELDGSFTLTAEHEDVKRFEVANFESSEIEVLGELVSSHTCFNWQDN